MEEVLKTLNIQLVLVCSFVSWGSIEAIKPLAKQWLSKPVYTFLFRAVSIIIGGMCGWFFGDDLKTAGLGCACGAMSTFTVALIKNLILKKAKVDIKEIKSEDVEVSPPKDS
jgi:hypothetical protein